MGSLDWTEAATLDCKYIYPLTQFTSFQFLFNRQYFLGAMFLQPGRISGYLSSNYFFLLTCTWFKLYYKIIAMKQSGRTWAQNQSQSFRVTSYKPTKQQPLNFWPSCQNYTWRKEASSTKGTGMSGCLQVEEWIENSLSHPCTKVNYKWINNFHVKPVA